jgi:hypothetical protein
MADHQTVLRMRKWFKMWVFKSNPNHNPKSTLTTARALTYNTCYAHTIKKENRVLDSQRSGLENVDGYGLLPKLA